MKMAMTNINSALNKTQPTVIALVIFINCLSIIYEF